MFILKTLFLDTISLSLHYQIKIINNITYQYNIYNISHITNIYKMNNKPIFKAYFKRYHTKQYNISLTYKNALKTKEMNNT